MHLDKVPNDGQPHAEAAEMPRYGIVGLPEPLEDVRQHVGPDANTGG
jgi:hypothetical protein